MKYNIFNSIIPLTNKSSLLYNAHSDSFIIFNSKIEDTIKNNFSELQAINPILAQKLIETKCYIENDVDEFAYIKERNNKVIYNDKTFFIMINPTLACNFKCWYCYETHVPKSKMSESVLQQTFTLFDNIIKENANMEYFSIAFFGGEPLLQFKSIVLPLIEYHAKLCKQNNLGSSISFTSNGALINQSIISELIKYEDVYFQITLDGDEKTHNKVRYTGTKGSYHTIINNIHSLLKNNIGVRLRINYTKENLESIKHILDDIQIFNKDMKTYFEIDFHRVWQDREIAGKEYELEGIRDTVDLFIGEGFKVIFNDRDELYSSCYADKKNTILLNYNGDVYKCSAKDFTKENRDGYLDGNGNVVWENSQDYRHTVKLRNKPCHTCRIAPLCGSGCTRFILDNEHRGEYCLFNYSNELMDQLILDRFDSLIRNKGYEIDSIS